MLALAGLSRGPAAVLASGAAYETWCRMIAAQGGDPDAPLPKPARVHVVEVPHGVLSRLDAYAVGVAAWRLGAGRARKEDAVEPAAGVVLHAKPGDTVSAGAPLLELHTDTPEAVPAALDSLRDAIEIGESAPHRPLVLDTIRVVSEAARHVCDHRSRFGPPPWCW